MDPSYRARRVQETRVQRLPTSSACRMLRQTRSKHACTNRIDWNFCLNHSNLLQMSELPCYCAKPFNCGRPCGVLLQCTRHTCELDCHVVKKQSDEKDKSQATHAKYCEQCTHDCELRRPSGCQHPWPIGHCHPADCPKCAKLNKFRCHCKANYVYVECDKWTRANESEQNELKSCRVPCTKTVNTQLAALKMLS